MKNILIIAGSDSVGGIIQSAVFLEDLYPYFYVLVR